MSNSGNQNSHPSGNAKIQSFLEALRNSQSRQMESDVKEPGSNPFAQFKEKKEAEKRRAEQFLQARKQEWNKIYSSKERQIEQRMEAIREDLKKLTKQVKILDKNIIRAVESPVVKAGEYHESFLLHIQKIIRLYTLEARDTNNWLSLYNSRSAKKGYYLGMAKSGGTSFTQANERSVATSVG